MPIYAVLKTEGKLRQNNVSTKNQRKPNKKNLKQIAYYYGSKHLIIRAQMPLIIER